MKEGFSNVIGKKLKEMGKTQSWLARKAGISRAEVSALVHQKIPAPTIQVAWKISKVISEGQIKRRNNVWRTAIRQQGF
jgi:plasmid maintenance system antidote protein VapI